MWAGVSVFVHEGERKGKRKRKARQNTLPGSMQSLSVFFTGFPLTGKRVWMLLGVSRVIKSFAGTLDSCQSPCQLVPL